MVRSTISGGYTEQMASFAVGADPLDPAAIAGLVARNGDGAVATFVGLVRDHNAGRRVLWLDYEAFAPLAVKAFERIGAEAAEKWPGTALAMNAASPCTSRGKTFFRCSVSPRIRCRARAFP